MRKIRDFLYGLWAEFLTQFGKLKVLTFGFFPILAYDPEPFYVTGDDIERIMGMVRPGDVVIRGYNKYLDGKFIPDDRGYSHAGICVGGNKVVHAASPCVSEIHIIDFCEADRILVLRPKSGQDDAVGIAMSKVGVPYDFDYKTDAGKLYCFELIANCYPDASIQTHEVKKFFGLVKRKCYLAKSIYGNDWFSEMFEKNEKVKEA